MTDESINDTPSKPKIYEDNYFQPNGNDDCDRRISRAARKLVRGHLLEVIEDNEAWEDDVWHLLEHWLHGNQRKECPLLPSLDVYRIDEEHSIEATIPKNFAGVYPTLTIQKRPRKSRPGTWFQCAYCGKTFSSRFYLDVHLSQSHSVSERSTYCPAVDWCSAVGLANCYQVALEDEPYYERGSNGWATDDRLIRHKLLKEAHSIPCKVEEIQAECHSILEKCGFTDPSENWCNSLSCPHHRFGDLPELWAREMEHSGGFLVLVVVLLLLFSLAACFVFLHDEESKNSQGRIPVSRASPTSKKRGKSD